MGLHLRLSQGFTPIREGQDLLLVGPGGRSLRLTSPAAPLGRLVSRLADGGGTLAELMRDDSPLSLYLELLQLEQRGVITITLIGGEGAALSLVPIGRRFRRQILPSDRCQMRLSRYLVITPADQGFRMMVPMQGSQLLLHDSRLVSVISQFIVPVDSEGLRMSLPVDLQKDVNNLIMLLLSSGVMGVIESDEQLSCDREATRQRWSWEDLLLHHRSRQGWHHEPIGATFQGVSAGPAPPLIPESHGLNRVQLPKLDPKESAANFFSVLERRRSVRKPGTIPMNLEQLGQLLWASLRVRSSAQVNAGSNRAYEGASRPVASGGAMHEIDTYLIVHRCQDLVSGLYRYDGREHVLVSLGNLNEASQQLLERACLTAEVSQAPDILMCFAARYGRASWKYEGIVYALILKHVGAIMQQLYLVATALGLSPCALGSGDSVLFAEATGLDPWSDAAVGEFMLSGP